MPASYSSEEATAAVTGFIEAFSLPVQSPCLGVPVQPYINYFLFKVARVDSVLAPANNLDFEFCSN